MTAISHMGEPAGLMVFRTVCEWLTLAALLLVFGLGAFAATVARTGIEPCVLPQRFSTAIRWAALAQLAILPLVLIAAVACMARVGPYAAITLIPKVLHETHFGHIWIASAPLAALLALTAWSPSRLNRVRAGGLALIGAVLLVLWAASGHAVDYGRAAIAVYFIHEAAAGLWIGSLAGLWLVAGLGDRVVESIAPRTSRVAGWCVATLILSGTYAGYDALGLSLDRLLYSSYGRALIWKMGLFAVVVAIGGYNRCRLIPGLNIASGRQTLLRNVALESVLLVAVLGLAALLGNTPPPR